MEYVGSITTEQALAKFSADLSTPLDIGPHLTCAEAEWLAAALAAAGCCQAAVALLVGHAEGDEDGDSHGSEGAVADACRRIGIVGADEHLTED